MPTVAEDDWNNDDDYLINHSEDEDLIECHECGREFYADGERCPNCGHYETNEDAPSQLHRGWVRMTAIMLLMAILLPALIQILSTN